MGYAGSRPPSGCLEMWLASGGETGLSFWHCGPRGGCLEPVLSEALANMAGRQSIRKLRRHWRAAALLVASLPLFQTACITDALSASFRNELTTSATLFTFEVAQTILANVFEL